MSNIWLMEEIQRHKQSQCPNTRFQAYLASLVVYKTDKEEFEFKGKWAMVEKIRLDNKFRGGMKTRWLFKIWVDDRLIGEKIIEVCPLSGGTTQIVSELLEWAFLY